MSRRDNADRRCAMCRMHEALCVCALIPHISTRTRLVLVIHRDEERKPTNTGLLAVRCLPNSEVHRRGDRDVVPTRFEFSEDVQPLFLYPHEGALPLASYVTGRPVTLVVPDGTWRQAGKVRARTPGLEQIPCVSLPEASAEPRRLRAETRPHGMATMEAIARALGVLEGAAVEAEMLRVMRVMVERTLWLRGELSDDELTDGVPVAARLRDPRGGGLH